ncbi:collagen triple helix repeat-containing protein 1-like [Apostichopus japonicus]|uniref:collagen triple helix repeat-containing protein 1-like n=1 Tax=Stichopus japonicus TaxID=307972 RepID=UPI003AB46C2B
MADMMITSFLNVFLFLSFLVLSGNGSQSCVGPRGLPGVQGDDGPIGTGTDDSWYDVSPSRNWKECTWESSDGSDSGTLYTCSFTKQSSTSSLFVAYGGTTRLYGCHGCCGRWYFAFNGAECSNPQVIDGTVYMAHYSGADLHRYRKISGVCDGLSAGSIDVTINVGNCAGYGSYDRHSGWNAVSRLLIEEWPASPY